MGLWAQNLETGELAMVLADHPSSLPSYLESGSTHTFLEV